MNNISTVQRFADPYFHDNIREMEAIEPDAGSARIARRDFTGHRIHQLPLMRENFTV